MTNPAPALYSLRILGSFAVVRDGRRVSLRHSAQRLPALLAVRGEHGRDEAAGVLWPDHPDRRANANLRTVLWRLRQDAPDLVTEDAGILYLDEDVNVDLHRLRSWARRAIRGDDHQTAPIPSETSLGLLSSWDETWVDEPRRELRLLCQYALEAVAHRLLISGRLGEAATVAAVAARLDPLREVPTRLMIEIHLRENDQTAALLRFHSFRRYLLTETGTEPSAALAGLVRVAPHTSRVERPLVSDPRVSRGRPPPPRK